MADHTIDDQLDEVPADHLDDAAEAWYRQIRNTPLLSADEEVELAQQVAEGNDEAFRRMVESNFRLVFSIARKHFRRSHGRMPLADLVQEGNLGLIRAVRKFDPTRGYRFSTYASYWIEQGIQRALEMRGPIIRVPSHIVELQRKIHAQRAALTGRLGREPTLEEIAESLQMNVAVIKQVENAVGDPVSLHADSAMEDAEPLVNLIPDEAMPSPEAAALIEDLRAEVRRALARLSPREREVILLRFGLIDGIPRTLDEVRVRYGISRERVRQIESAALRKLRRWTSPV